jgi:hypothetical protein
MPGYSLDEDFAVYYASGSARSDDAHMLEDGGPGAAGLDSGGASLASTLLDEDWIDGMRSGGEGEEDSALFAAATPGPPFRAGGCAAAARQRSLLTAKLRQAGAAMQQQQQSSPRQQQLAHLQLQQQLALPAAAPFAAVAGVPQAHAPLPLWMQQLVAAQGPMPLPLAGGSST